MNLTRTSIPPGRLPQSFEIANAIAGCMQVTGACFVTDDRQSGRDDRFHWLKLDVPDAISGADLVHMAQEDFGTPRFW
ncbi:hypothetical protein [uncultured Ruegeria sp.]|uniref:hypothetical protein n=1 Tax=uncultured Ruegeria sp. TaxID=259304 RepID=UPI00262C01F7|nr:hypothetical protein [uncultured Ruegeria sp.]